MKIGLVVNPWAGIGGAVALKGSDGAAVRAEALKRGAVPRANEKTAIMLSSFTAQAARRDDVTWYCAPGQMGSDALNSNNIKNVNVMALDLPQQTEAQTSRDVVAWLMDQQVDLIVFAGGDGTARDVYSQSLGKVPVIGIPAGVKIHSGVFAVTPNAAGEVLAGLVDGRITDLRVEEVRDIDEEAFRKNIVRAKHFGDMPVPVFGQYMQHTKIGGTESEALVLSDIADWLNEQMEEDICYFVGSGKSTATLMENLGLENTLLGVDAVLTGKVIKADCTEQDLLNLQAQHRCKAIVSVIGGQGHIFGRGNAQFSPQVLAKLQKENVIVLGTKTKLTSLNGRPLLLDTTSPELDKAWSGFITVTTGYNDQVIYPVETL